MSACGLQLPATLVFDYPTLEALAVHLSGEMLAAEPSAAESVALDLDQLQLTLASMSAEEAKRSGVAARLQSLLSGWASEDHPDGDSDNGADDDLGSVSDDEIFELIDREFGVS